jgi:uncharacterized membrane protein YeaQ/YmgE (transglycosylase-associated protein family)
MKRGGYGMRWDIFLGLVGSVAGSWIFWALSVSRGSGLIALARVAFIGAAIPIVGQRLVTTPPLDMELLVAALRAQRSLSGAALRGDLLSHVPADVHLP